MKILVVLLSIFGLGLALQPSTLYTYKYVAKVATGLPNSRSQVAGSGIRADVKVYMSSKSQGIVQFENIMVGEYHGDVACDLHSDVLPVQWSPLPQAYKELEESFKVTFNAQSEVMEVPSADKEWMTNIRKSVVNQLRIAPIRANMGEAEGDQAYELNHQQSDQNTLVYDIEEDTILGRCPSQYTISRMPEFFAENEENSLRPEMKEDVERSGKKSSVRKELQMQKLWRAVKSIDFNHCQDPVVLQHVGFGNATNFGRGNIDYIQSRTSTSQYILRGAPGNFRLERALIEGSYTQETYGYTSQDEQLQLLTNQTLVIQSVQDAPNVPKSMALPASLHPVQSWKYGVISPYSPQKYKLFNWVHYLGKSDKIPMNLESVITGMQLDPSKIQEYKAAFERVFEEAIAEISKKPETHVFNNEKPSDSNADKATILLHQASVIAQGLEMPEIEAVWTKFAKSDSLKQMLIADVLAASGTRAAARVLLAKMKSNEITSTRAATIFMTFTNSVLEPKVFEDIMKFVKTEIDLNTRPFFGSAALVNFAQLAHRQCVNQLFKNTTVPTPTLGDNICTRAQVIEELLPYLRERLTQSKTSWERAIYAQAIGNLGVQEAIDVLLPYINGKYEKNPRTRSTAMYSLASWKLPPSARDLVFEHLMPLVDNIGEDSEVRQRAIKVMLSWSPDASWWQRLAAMTWHEPSRQMQSFISSTIYSTGKLENVASGRQTHYARQAIHLSRPVAPSLKYSYNLKGSVFNRPAEAMTAGELSWITNEESVIPRDIDAYLSLTLGGFNYRLFDIVIQNDGVQEPLYRFFDKLRNMVEPSGTANLKSSDARLAQDIYQKFIDAVQMNNYQRHQPEAMIYTKFFDNMQQYFQLNSDVINKYLAGSKSIIHEMIEGKPIQVTKYFNPAPVTTAIASEIGLPVVSHTYAPILNVAEGNIKLNVDNKPTPSFYDFVTAQKVEAKMELKYKFVSKATTTLRLLTPWSEKELIAGIDSERQINIPISVNVEYDRSQQAKQMSVTVQPTVQSKFPLFHAHSVPFTTIKSMWPHKENDVNNKNVKIIYTDLEKRQAQHELTHKFGKQIAGIDTEVQWDGDVDYPFQSGDLAALVIDSIRAPGRLLTTLGGVDARIWRVNLNVNPASSPTKQVTLKTSYVPSVLGLGQADGQLQVEDTDVQRLEKINKMINTQTPVSLLRGVLLLTGGEKRVFDSSVAWQRSLENQKEISDVFLAFLRSPLPGYAPELAAVCLTAQATSPQISDYASFMEVLKSQPKIDVTGQIMAGTCQINDAVATFDIHAKLSQQRQQELLKEVECDSCTMNKGNHSYTGFPISAVYDRATADFKIVKSVPKYLRNATYIAGNIFSGIMFPQMSIDKMDVSNTEKQVHLEAKRPIESQYWTIWAKLPHQNVIVNKMYMPHIVDTIFPLGGVFTPMNTVSQMLLRTPSKMDRCVIEKERVETFDGMKYESKVLPCWTVAAKDRAEENSFVLETREHAGVLEARITSRTRSSIVDMKEGEVKVNGKKIAPSSQEEIKDQSGRVFVRVINQNGKYAVEMPSKMTVYMANGKIQIEAGMRYKGMMGGLCGDYDGESKYDLQGPKHFTYGPEEYHLFHKSWVSEQTDCPNFSSMKAEVQKFQSESNTRAPSHSYQPSITANYIKNSEPTYMWIYKIIEIKHHKHLCVAVEPIKKCINGHVGQEHVDTKIIYKCWKKSQCPLEILNNASKGYLEHPFGTHGQYQKRIKTEHYNKCV